MPTLLAMTAALVIDEVGERLPTSHPVLDIVVPVYNEAAVLRRSIERLHRYLRRSFPFTWRITIVDNASTDTTWEEASALAALLSGVTACHLARKGRGLALRTAWAASDAKVVSYMDVDLSTGLDALLPLVAPLVSGHSDVAIGSRLAAGAAVARGPKREVISRAYNLILRATFGARFRDAQCGFKAVRTEVVHRLLPEIADDGWFFDTELLLLAEHNGLRIHEVPVDWVDDPDSRVDLARTASHDLRGLWRVARRFVSGRGRIELGTTARPAMTDDMGRRLVPFAAVGALSTLVSLLIFVALHSALGAIGADVVALTATTLGNTWANRRYTFEARGHVGRWRHYAGGTAIYVGGLVLSTLALGIAGLVGGGLPAELVALAVAWTLTGIARFALLSAVVFGARA